MTLDDFTKQDLEDLIGRAKAYMLREFELEAGRFELEGLVAFFAQELGARAYNKGLADAQATLMKHVDDINDALYQLERQPPSSR